MNPACGLCGQPGEKEVLAEAFWLSPEAASRMARDHPGWTLADGACPACVQETLLDLLRERGEDAFHDAIQRIWPIDAEAAFGALPTPLRLHADSRCTGRGITLALVDAAFYPHEDLVAPRNRIRAWVDASRPAVNDRRFSPDQTPGWPGWDASSPEQWHGLMTSAVAAGNGHRSHGLYRGLAPDAEIVLVQVRDDSGRITNDSIARALQYLLAERSSLGLCVVSLSLGGDAVPSGSPNPVDDAVRALVTQGVVVVAAAGNDGVRRLTPPGTAPEALTVGGLDDRNSLEHGERAIWHGNYGMGSGGKPKPEVVAPSLFVAAPILPGTPLAAEALLLFARRAFGEPSVEARLSETKLLSPHYQHVEGTSFAAPIVAATAACMLEANPGLKPRQIAELLIVTAERVPGASDERQGAGAINAGKAVRAAISSR